MLLRQQQHTQLKVAARYSSPVPPPTPECFLVVLEYSHGAAIQLPGKWRMPLMLVYATLFNKGWATTLSLWPQDTVTLKHLVKKTNKGTQDPPRQPQEPFQWGQNIFWFQMAPFPFASLILNRSVTPSFNSRDQRDHVYLCKVSQTEENCHNWFFAAWFGFFIFVSKKLLNYG